jgi:hypothetical protein
VAPLTLDDLLPLDEFAARRAEFFESHRRYLDRYRRVRVGPALTLVFENRQTLWFKVQDVLRVARLADPDRVRRELAWYSRLLPARGRLNAALVFDPTAVDAKRSPDWTQTSPGGVRLLMGGVSSAARIVTARPEDRCIGTSHWAEFELVHDGRTALESARAVWIEARHPEYEHRSSPLGPSVRQSLIDDLLLSDRDAAA